MTTITSKSMPEILIERMNATREERRAFMDSAERCAFMEESIKSMIESYGFSVVQTECGYALEGAV